ncbi:hypothetical protein ACFPN2_13425 [Steroidobacter flavus]|uniref:Restriction endonuclease type IV Mrr domain-containing protein n=1 Tax=Steroidobacter flavus TaxID=1842136 RepID=A0ABV8SRW0_9GAMM
MSTLENLLEILRRIWQEMIVGLDEAEKEPVLRRLDEHRMEFSWQGRTLLLNAWTKIVQRGKKGLVKFDDIQAIGIVENGGDEATYKVILQIKRSANIHIGTTTEQVDASIAAAHLAKATGKSVCIL